MREKKAEYSIIKCNRIILLASQIETRNIFSSLIQYQPASYQITSIIGFTPNYADAILRILYIFNYLTKRHCICFSVSTNSSLVVTYVKFFIHIIFLSFRLVLLNKFPLSLNRSLTVILVTRNEKCFTTQHYQVLFFTISCPSPQDITRFQRYTSDLISKIPL